MPSTTSATFVLQRLRAVADETRLAILNELASGERCVCELMEVLELKQPLLSFHLKILKDAELITCRREGRWCYYSMHVPAIRELGFDIQEMVAKPKRKGRACN
jgi:ArsR family transcriptional regulator, arsenate/arsenite/antimonite-responsive transcriptional repressor